MAEPAPPTPTRHVTTTRVVAVRGSSLEYRADRVVGEDPLEIRAAGPGQAPVAVAVTMRTPGHEEELAIGFLRTEGLIEGPEVLRVESGDPASMNQPDDQITVRLAKPFDASRVAERHFVATASCGICGKASIDAVRTRGIRPPNGDLRLDPELLTCLPAALRSAQALFERTGGLHAAALFDAFGTLLVVREDVGRHNAVDKIVGQALLAGRLPLSEHILFVSGRGGFEIVQKAAVAGLPVVACVSAPSSLAVQLARETDLTLIGFLRGRRFIVYSGERRLGARPTASIAATSLAF